jgi:hypothetical protein
VAPLLELLSSPSASYYEEDDYMPKYILRPAATGALLRYLDDLSWLVETYEKFRSEGRAAEFRKSEVVLKAILELQDQVLGERRSIRHVLESKSPRAALSKT